MKGNNYLVTGSSRGIGRGVTEYLLEKGANVIMVATNADKLQELVLKYPEQAFALPYDLTNLDDINEIFEYCKNKGMKLNGLFHAAGLSENCPVKLVDNDFAQRIFSVNYFAFVQLVRFFLMKKYSVDGSNIIVMSSVASVSCEKGMSQYASSKAAINAFVKVAAKEAVKRRIRINAIAPSFVDTDMTRISGVALDGFQDKIEREQPFGIIPIKDIVNLYSFLTLDESQNITGAVIPVCGGGVV